MPLIGAIFVILLILGGTGLYVRNRVGRMARSGSPSAARTARAVQHGGTRTRTAVSGKAQEIWAEAHSADWLERRRARRARQAARPPVSQRAGRAARVTGRGTVIAGRGIGRGVAAARRKAAQVRQRGTVPAAPATNVTPIRPAAAPAPAAPAERKTPTMSTPGATSGNSHGGGAGGGLDPIREPPRSGNGSGSGGSIGGGADLFTAIQQITGHGKAGGLRAKQRAISVLSDGLDYIATQVQSFATDLSEPTSNYGPPIWEPLSQSAAHIKAAASNTGESASAMNALAGMSVGELADSPVKAPHSDELNAAS